MKKKNKKKKNKKSLLLVIILFLIIVLSVFTLYKLNIIKFNNNSNDNTNTSDPNAPIALKKESINSYASIYSFNNELKNISSFVVDKDYIMVNGEYKGKNGIWLFDLKTYKYLNGFEEEIGYLKLNDDKSINFYTQNSAYKFKDIKASKEKLELDNYFDKLQEVTDISSMPSEYGIEGELGEQVLYSNNKYIVSIIYNEDNGRDELLIYENKKLIYHNYPSDREGNIRYVQSDNNYLYIMYYDTIDNNQLVKMEIRNDIPIVSKSQDEYEKGITIVTGRNVIDGFDVNNNQKQIEISKRIINETIATLPNGLIDEILSGNRDSLVINLVGKDSNPTDFEKSGIAYYDDNTYYILLDISLISEVSDSISNTLIHELMHIMDFNMSFRNIELNWEDYNPTDYKNLNPKTTDMTPYQPDIDKNDVWFIDEYAKTNALEDKAVTFLHLYLDDTFEEYPNLNKKVEYLKSLLNNNFTSFKNSTDKRWK